MTEPRSSSSGALLLAGAFACASAGAWAQPVVSPSAAASAAERAQKETDRTMYWIRVLADKPAPVKAAPAPKPVVAAAPPAPRPSLDKARPAAAPTAASTTANTATVAQAPAPASVVQELPPVADVPAPAPAPAALELPPPQAAEPDPGLIQVKSVQPDFPTAIVRRFHQGNVEVQFEVDAGGTVTDATVVESSHPRLNDAALEAVRQWRFKPGPRAHTAQVNLVYNIDVAEK